MNSNPFEISALALGIRNSVPEDDSNYSSSGNMVMTESDEHRVSEFFYS